MEAILYHRYGSPEVLIYGTLSKPLPDPNQVLIRIHAAALNPIDLEVRSGKFRPMTGWRFPKIPSVDFAGVIEAVGKKVSGFQIGDEVYGMNPSQKGGAVAQYIAIAPNQIAHKPQNLSFEEAASVPLAAQTSLQAIVDLGKLKAGQKILINGASGGVGVFAIQIANILGAHTTAICSHRNVDLVKSLGADEVVDYTKTKPVDIQDRFDFFYDVYGNYPLGRCQHLLNPKGVHVSTIPRPATFIRQAFNPFFARQTSVVVVRSRTRQLDQLRAWIEAGKLKAVIDQVFAMEDAVKAYEYLASRRAKGKVVIRIN
ncbi:MAG: NAD(P)-dependent alcohol dehydrogenase, partial [Bacteroidota bacterium]